MRGVALLLLAALVPFSAAAATPPVQACAAVDLTKTDLSEADAATAFGIYLEAVEPVQTDTQVQNHLLVQAEPEEMAKAVAEVPEELQDLEDLVLL